MEFQSPRFAANPTLEEILNDPDTGRKKLAKGSPSDAVTAVQQALLDLHWVERWTGPSGTVLVPSQFVDGDYGPWTVATVLAYKRHYDIHFPPTAATGIFDGFTGPATLRSLDRHCVLLDESDAAITSHADELLSQRLVHSLELAAPDGLGRTATPIRRSAGSYRGAMINAQVGGIIYKRRLGAFALHGPLFVEWMTRELAVGSGDATGALGFPVSEMSSSGSITSAMVERGTIFHDSSTGTTTVDVDPRLSAARQDVEF